VSLELIRPINGVTMAGWSSSFQAASAASACTLGLESSSRATIVEAVSFVCIRPSASTTLARTRKEESRDAATSA
jgi:hypothetical protein